MGQPTLFPLAKKSTAAITSQSQTASDTGSTEPDSVNPQIATPSPTPSVSSKPKPGTSQSHSSSSILSPTPPQSSQPKPSTSSHVGTSILSPTIATPDIAHTPPSDDPKPQPKLDAKQKYDKTNRKRDYIQAWEVEFPWVRCESGIMFCTVCREFPNLSDARSTVVKGVAGNKRRETLVSHCTSSSHLKCEQRKAMELKGNRGDLDKCIEKQVSKLTDEQQMQLSALMNTAFYVAKRKMAFDSFASLCDLQEKNGLQLGSQYRHDKACRNFVQSIASVEKRRIVEDVKSARFIAVMGDGSTDISVTEQEGVFVRYYNYSLENNKTDIQ